MFGKKTVIVNDSVNCLCWIFFFMYSYFFLVSIYPAVTTITRVSFNFSVASFQVFLHNYSSNVCLPLEPSSFHVFWIGPLVTYFKTKNVLEFILSFYVFLIRFFLCSRTTETFLHNGWTLDFKYIDLAFEINDRSFRTLSIKQIVKTQI